MKIDPMVGKKFGKLHVMRRLPNRKRGSANFKSRVLCECECGNRIVIPRYYLLRKANPRVDCRSCDKPIEDGPFQYKVEYHTWMQMRQRCSNPNHVSYTNYGGRGIEVCARWDHPTTGFDAFLSDVGQRPVGKTIDRIDVDGNYEPDNVRWATAKEQAANKRNSKRT